MRTPSLSLVTGLAVLVGLLAAQPASANRFVDIEVPSRFVDILEEPGGDVPGRPSTLHANVLLPDNYDPQRRRGYPVLYLLHGANGDYRTWEGFLEVAELAADFPGIIVMPDGGHFGMYTDWYNRGDFGKPRWMSFHLVDLRRAIDKRFPIRSGRRWHAIAGVSMGGMGAVRYASARPGYFGSVAGFSAAALDTKRPESITVVDATGQIIGDGATYEDIWGPPTGYYATATNPQDLIPNLEHTRVFITSGDGTPCPGDPVPAPNDVLTEAGLRQQANAWVEAARSAAVDVTDEHTCGAHTGPTAQRAFTAALDWGFFGRVKRRLSNWTYITAARRAQAHGFRLRFDEQPTEVIRFERVGKLLRGEGTGTVRIRRGGRCEITRALPFEVTLPRECRGSR